MDALERYYREYLMDYAQDSNWEGYDVDAQFTRNRIEKILDKGYMDPDDAAFVRSILPDVENERIRADIEEYLESLIVL